MYALHKLCHSECSEEPRSRRTDYANPNCVINQLLRGPSRPFGMTGHPQRDHFPQHPQAVAEKTNFASLSVIPAHGNLPDSQAGTLREIKQLNIESETLDTRCLQDRPANIEAKRLEPALRIPKRQPCREAHEQIKNPASLLASPRLVDPD